MSEESRDLHTLREGSYARALSDCTVPVEVEPDVDESDNWPLMICRSCGKRKPIRPLTHCCQECFEDIFDE